MHLFWYWKQPKLKHNNFTQQTGLVDAQNKQQHLLIKSLTNKKDEVHGVDHNTGSWNDVTESLCELVYCLSLSADDRH